MPLPLQAVPQDLTRNRNFYFGEHLDDWYSGIAKRREEVPEALPSPVAEPLTALGLDAQIAEPSDNDSDTLENRFVSMTAESEAGFLNALLADKSLTQEQRQALAKVRMSLAGNAETKTAIESLAFPADSVAQQFRQYLSAASDFYAGQYDAAQQAWMSLKDSSQPWLAETSSYMLIRNALNKSSQNATGEYGDFDVDKIDRESAMQAGQWTQNYLQHWPEGLYAASATGLLRRINWYLQDWDSLGKQYEQVLTTSKDAHSLVALITENDSKLQSKDFTWNTSYFLSAPEAPLLTFTQTLRLMRNMKCDGRQPCVNPEYLSQIKPIFEHSSTLAYWQYLDLMRSYLTQDYTRVIHQIKPVTALPPNDILTFSNQVLYGNALMALNQWSEARMHWSALLTSSKDVEQQQFLQSQLAATLIGAGQTEVIFAPDSLVTSLRYRSIVLKTRATPALLRQQISDAPNDEERTIALHSLLMRDLIEGNYSDWLLDKKRVSNITHPAIGEAFSDVDLSVFDWLGAAPEKGYFCKSLEQTVSALSKNSHDSHALNCLGEFFRTTDAKIDLWKDGEGNASLGDVTLGNEVKTQPSRQDYYEEIITNEKSEPEDKSYALYRAVMCYSPSGYNDCGGKEVDKLKRKGWFTQLKTQYPGSPWAQELRYYW
ncbi:hypothetical protein RHD99_09065 [Buttiauxella selenatireducens]|uniref:Uncharacterized protein n=1 Tax=Buttiauxella selenatireducens TaxID=3073902 RepID=A0ABY9SGU4_9ENTR|nr:hypothetical protein [Buttiauxella sp. R73]WMY76065.1 hypothetical protein RHD99_09065 [Buttiauxella sp. R73]